MEIVIFPLIAAIILLAAYWLRLVGVKSLLPLIPIALIVSLAFVFVPISVMVFAQFNGQVIPEIGFICMFLLLWYRYGVLKGFIYSSLMIAILQNIWSVEYTLRGFPDPSRFLAFGADGLFFWFGVFLFFEIVFILPAARRRKLNLKIPLYFLLIAVPIFLVVWAIGIPPYLVLTGPTAHFYDWVAQLNSIFGWIGLSTVFLLLCNRLDKTPRGSKF